MIIKRTFINAWLLSLMLMLNINAAFAHDDHTYFDEFLDRLATPKGAVIVTIANAFINGTFNALWALNFNYHFGIDQNTTIIINETGGLGAAGQSIILGMGLSYLLYRHQTKTAKLQENCDTLEAKTELQEVVVAEVKHGE